MKEHEEKFHLVAIIGRKADQQSTRCDVFPHRHMGLVTDELRRVVVLILQGDAYPGLVHVAVVIPPTGTLKLVLNSFYMNFKTASNSLILFLTFRNSER